MPVSCSLLVLAALNARLALAENVMTVNLPASNNWVLGTTLDGMLNSGLPTPFTQESFAEFEAAWDRKEWTQQGTFSMVADIVTSQTEAVEVLDIAGQLEFSYMLFSGDAHLEFAKENVQSELDVSVIFKASAAGKKKQMSIAETNLLEIKETGADSLDDFKRMYGEYLVVGFEYGGEVLFESTRSAKSKEDKLAIEAGMTLSYSSGGFDMTEVSGSAEVKYEKSDVSRSIADRTKSSIRPNADSATATSLISTLSKLSNGAMQDDDSLKEALFTDAQKLLSSDADADPIKAVVIPLASVKAVNDLLGDNAILEDTVEFYKFLNGMLMTVEGLLRQLELAIEQWQALSPETLPKAALFDWRDCLHRYVGEMTDINNIHEIVEYAAAYKAARDTRSWSVVAIESESFVEFQPYGLEEQFETAVMQPYYAMLKTVDTKEPTQKPTAKPTTTRPPTSKPTPRPTRRPTPRPTSYTLKSSRATSGLNVCEGHCKSDSQCSGNLNCVDIDIGVFERLKDFSAFGCKGKPKAWENKNTWNYCVAARAVESVELDEIQAALRPREANLDAPDEVSESQQEVEALEALEALQEQLGDELAQIDDDADDAYFFDSTLQFEYDELEESVDDELVQIGDLLQRQSDAYASGARPESKGVRPLRADSESEPKPKGFGFSRGTKPSKPSTAVGVAESSVMAQLLQEQLDGELAEIEDLEQRQDDADALTRMQSQSIDQILAQLALDSSPAQTQSTQMDGEVDEVNEFEGEEESEFEEDEDSEFEEEELEDEFAEEFGAAQEQQSEPLFFNSAPRSSGDALRSGAQWSLGKLFFVTAIIAAGCLMAGIMVGNACIRTAPAKRLQVEVAERDDDADM